MLVVVLLLPLVLLTFPRLDTEGDAASAVGRVVLAAPLSWRNQSLAFKCRPKALLVLVDDLLLEALAGVPGVARLALVRWVRCRLFETSVLSLLALTMGRGFTFDTEARRSNKCCSLMWSTRSCENGAR